MRQEILENLKNNIGSNIKNYTNDSNTWLYEQYEKPFLEYKRLADDFQLKCDLKNIGDSDIENIKIFHSKLKFLSKSEASDERLWAGLTHSLFWEFMQERWSKKPPKEDKDVINRYFLNKGISDRRGLVMNTLSRYWWIGELIYDEKNLEDPYYLIEVFRSDFATRIHTMFSSNFTSNSNIVKGVLKPMLYYKKKNGNLSRDEYQAILRYANLLGGSYLLDYLSVEEIEEKISHFINTVILSNKIDNDIIVKEEFKNENDNINKKSIIEKLKDSILKSKHS